MTLVAVARAASVWIVMHAPAREVPEPQPWRLVTKPCLHVGARPATDGEGVAVTVQVTVCSPF